MANAVNVDFITKVVEIECNDTEAESLAAQAAINAAQRADEAKDVVVDNLAETLAAIDAKGETEKSELDAYTETKKADIDTQAAEAMQSYVDAAAASAAAAAATAAGVTSLVEIGVDTTLTITGAAADAKVTGDNLKATVIGQATYINSSNKASICNGTMDSLPVNTIRTVASGAGLTNTPPGFENVIFGVCTFSCSHIRDSRRGMWQLAVSVGTSTVCVRSYNTSWSAWKKLANSDDLTTYLKTAAVPSSGVLNAATYEYKLSNVKDAVCSFFSPDDFLDSPYTGAINTTLLVLPTNGTFATQVVFPTYTSNRNIYTRLIYRTSGNVFSDWRAVGGYDCRNILAIGDSICAGGRNNNNGFVGLLGIPFVNAGVSGATLASGTGHTWIEQELVDRTEANFDAIIMQGGVNDYNNDVPLGTLSSVPVRTTDTSAYNALDTTTVLGATEHLFVTLAGKYPNIDKFFLISHKIKNWPFTKNYNGGYTQEELHDAMVACCNLYNVQVIDVYRDSPMNSYFPEYVSPTDWASDHSVTDLYWINSDQVHPLNYGYVHGYVPLIRKALAASSHK